MWCCLSLASLLPFGLVGALSPLQLLGGHRLGGGGQLHPGLKAGGGCLFPRSFPFQHQHKAATKQRMPQPGPGNSQVQLWGGKTSPALLCGSISLALPWGRGAVGHSGSPGQCWVPLRADSRVLYEAPRRPLPRRGRDKGMGSSDLGRRVNTAAGCWLLPAPLPCSSRCCQQPPRLVPSRALCLWQQGHHSGGWRRTPRTLVPGGSHLFTRPITGFGPAAPSAPCWHWGHQVYH